MQRDDLKERDGKRRREVEVGDERVESNMKR